MRSSRNATISIKPPFGSLAGVLSWKAADIDVVNLRGPHGPKEQLANISYSAAVRG
jgi:hypothetical protein